jgi:hypothetical protein
MKKLIIGIVALAGIATVVLLSWKPVVLWLYIANSSRKHPQELACARLFCQRIIANDAPTVEWLSSVDDWDKIADKTNYFYFLKVHFAECKTRPSDLDRGRIWVFEENLTNALAYFYYQRHVPYLQMTFQKVNTNRWKVRAIFPLNNCFFDPDVNKDGTLDRGDVEAAMKLKD